MINHPGKKGAEMRKIKSLSFSLSSGLDPSAAADRVLLIALSLFNIFPVINEMNKFFGNSLGGLRFIFLFGNILLEGF